MSGGAIKEHDQAVSNSGEAHPVSGRLKQQEEQTKHTTNQATSGNLTDYILYVI